MLSIVMPLFPNSTSVKVTVMQLSRLSTPGTSVVLTPLYIYSVL